MAIACHLDKVATAKLLVENIHVDVDVNMLCAVEGGIRQRTALHHAVYRGHRAMVAFLITVPDVNVNAVDDQGLTALHYAVSGGYHYVVELLVTVPSIDLNACVSNGWNALLYAVHRGRLDMVECLLTVPGKDIDVNAHGRINFIVQWTALHLAVNGRHRDIVERLLMVPGIDVNFVGSNDAETAQQLAARRGYHEIVKLFELVRV